MNLEQELLDLTRVSDRNLTRWFLGPRVVDLRPTELEEN